MPTAHQLGDLVPSPQHVEILAVSTRACFRYTRSLQSLRERRAYALRTPVSLAK